MSSSRWLCWATALGACAFVSGCHSASPSAEAPAPLNPNPRPAVPYDTQSLARNPASDAAIKAALTSSQQRAAQKEAEGVAKASEYEALSRIMTYAYNTKTTTDADIAFVAALLRCGPLRNSGINQNALRMHALSSLVTVKNATPQQKSAIVAAIAPICEDPPENLRAPIPTADGPLQSADVSVQSTALIVLGHCDTPKAREICARLAKSSATARIRKDAESNLRRWKQKGQAEKGVV